MPMAEISPRWLRYPNECVCQLRLLGAANIEVMVHLKVVKTRQGVV
jgi:hypothetical protein